jgi:hypothetical protein
VWVSIGQGPLGARRRLTGRRSGHTINNPSKETPVMSATVLWIIAAILVIVGIVQLIQGQIILGIVLLIAACLVGPGGYSIFRSRHA